MNKYLRVYILILFAHIAFCIEVKADILQRRPIVVISIDAETIGRAKRSISLVEQFDLNINGELSGITKIMEICDKHNVKATFFLDVYEYKRYGETALKNIAKALDERGFDVELHTHPQWSYDSKRNMMYQYSLEEQIEIIKDGKELIKKWINKKPVIHRAGAYSANKDTLKALYANHIFCDTSYYYAYPTCRLQNLNLKKNYISVSNDVYQFPVNVFLLERHSAWFNFLDPLQSIVKYDIDSTDIDTLTKAIDKGIEYQFDIIVLFLHSFSFIDEYNKENKTPDLIDIREFDTLLNYIKRKGLQIVTFRQLIDGIDTDRLILRDRDIIPVVSADINTFKFLAKKAGINRRNIQDVVIYTSIIIIVLLVLIYIIGRRISGRDTTRSS